jgi:hypothetical protein
MPDSMSQKWAMNASPGARSTKASLSVSPASARGFSCPDSPAHPSGQGFARRRYLRSKL